VKGHINLGWGKEGNHRGPFPENRLAGYPTVELVSTPYTVSEGTCPMLGQDYKDELIGDPEFVECFGKLVTVFIQHPKHRPSR
jgi:hypothetical protein